MIFSSRLAVVLASLSILSCGGGGRSSDGTSAGGTSAGDAAAGGTLTGGSSSGGTSAGDAAAGGTLTGGSSTGGASAGGISVGGASAGESAAGDSAAGESAAGGTGGSAPATGWNTVKVGGGGYVPGIIYHPTVANLRYARTDVAGVYRWDNGSSQWTPLTDAFGRSDGSQEGAESVAVDPTNANWVFMTTSMSVLDGNGRFYSSSNQGKNWNSVLLPFPVGANDQGRAIGERLAVDPNLSTTLFYGSRSAGLWKSTDRGQSWNQITTLSSYKMTTDEMKGSNGERPIGVEFVVFDASVPTTGFVPTGNATQTLYVGVAPDYRGLAGLSYELYRSTDGGATWTGIALPAAVTSAITDKRHIPHLARAADGMFYVPFSSGSGPGSGAPSAL